ncbi:hypothetical protein NDU88_000778 [Pleurodeles waltl]|uniref:Uncharacterized protein n=1 Tax=Pleurodeles waltl TaxID=8319 RepID=A0AAV7R7T6_PLEWA|nr:hypothetical protein NDU88_000778 [Pleurodeles waltl]
MGFRVRGRFRFPGSLCRAGRRSPAPAVRGVSLGPSGVFNKNTDIRFHKDTGPECDNWSFLSVIEIHLCSDFVSLSLSQNHLSLLHGLLPLILQNLFSYSNLAAREGSSRRLS